MAIGKRSIESSQAKWSDNWHKMAAEAEDRTIKLEKPLTNKILR